METLKVKRNNANACLPKRQSNGSAGYDLYSCETAIVNAQSWKLINTGLSITVPNETYGRVAPRSGLSLKGICIGAGVIDSDYTGNIGVVMYNHGNSDFEVNIGDRIAQLIIEKIATPLVEEVNEINQTQRGEKGFGSTGQ